MTKVVFILTIHGRDELTSNLLAQISTRKPNNWQVQVVINVDGMHDTTIKMLESVKEDITPLVDHDDYHWAKGMKRAEDYVARNLNYDYLIWVNNDVSLKEDALQIVSNCMKDFQTPILVGSFTDSKTGRKSYGGSGYPKFRSMNWYKPLPILDIPIETKIANGNFVVFPKELHQDIGGIDSRYHHANADSDIILRASKLGIQTLVIPGTLGLCDSNVRYFNRSLLKMLIHEFSYKRTPIGDIRLLCKAQFSKLCMILFLHFISAIVVRQTKIWLVTLKKLYFPNPWIRKP